MPGDKYCVDASSLIKMKQDYPRKVFPTLWEKMEELVRVGRLIAPDEVQKEIEKDDLWGPWAKQNKKMFKRPDQDQINAAKDVVTRFPSIAKPGKFGPAADPFVVGLVRLENKRLSDSLLDSRTRCAVVTEERGPSRLPGACAQHKVTCITLVDLFQTEAWVFR
jgi:hypothetical protein